jgi:hypothetical protein
MADTDSSTRSELLPCLSIGGGPMTSVYAFSARDAVLALGQMMMALLAALKLGRRRAAATRPARGEGAGTGSAAGGDRRGGELTAPSYAYSSPCNTWHFRLLHLTGLMVILPMVAATRLLPRRGHRRPHQSVFVETNDAVLTALGFAFTT